MTLAVPAKRATALTMCAMYSRRIFAYKVPFGRSRWYGAWQWERDQYGRAQDCRSTCRGDVQSHRRARWQRARNSKTGSVSRVPLYLDYGTTGLWLNPAAFSVPAREPGQISAAMSFARRDCSRSIRLFPELRLTERMGFEFGIEAFNILNHPRSAPRPQTVAPRPTSDAFTSAINTSPVARDAPGIPILYAAVVLKL